MRRINRQYIIFNVNWHTDIWFGENLVGLSPNEICES